MSTFRNAFGWYVRRRIRSGLDGLWVRGLDEARDAARNGPVVLAATHVAWWDGMLLFPLDDALGRNGRVWMDAENLERLPFFRALGAMPLDRRSPSGLRASMRTAIRWLDRADRALWVFPQGRHRPPWIRPLDLAPGTGWLARQAGATLLPVAFAYGFREAPVPSAVVSIGAPVNVDIEGLERGLVRELDRADAFLLGQDPSFEPLLPGRVGGTHQGLAARLLGRVFRGR